MKRPNTPLSAFHFPLSKNRETSLEFTVSLGKSGNLPVIL
jgi:hypothetical protein